jgi:dipeptidyl aminopeptidase/acylaminoacyl peptidase
VAVADGSVRKLVEQDGSDSGPVWSPDGSRIAFSSSMKKEFSFLNNGIGIIPATGGAIAYVTTAFDENPSIVDWNRAGLFFSAAQRTSSYLFSVDPATKAIKRFSPAEQWMGSGFSLTPDGQWAAFTATDSSTLGEIYVAPVAPAMKPRKLTDMTAQIAGWTKAPIEVVSWKSQDGATIEGVLHKPAGYQPGRKYPLLVVIHGGPTGTSRPNAFSSTSIYPIDIWTAKGALVLEPNYRGSAGYGEAFRSLNVRNLGVGDAWDVLSGVDTLIGRGWVDSTRMGAMGWSQGGYISAYLTTHDSARFKAVSVGAGISDWTTYYVNTDITQFTRHYLKATPWDDPEIYAKTSPITYIKNAKAPTLIQHGATDQRVPPPNAYELYRGLQDVGVPSKLIIYKGFEGVGHGPSKPKSSRAVMQHNLDWFDKYIFGGSSTTTSQQEK